MGRFEESVRSGVDQAMRETELEIRMTLKDAVEKQIPYKPTKCSVTYGKCKCGVGFMDKETNYCGNCGQRLLWGGKDD